MQFFNVLTCITSFCYPFILCNAFIACYNYVTKYIIGINQGLLRAEVKALCESKSNANIKIMFDQLKQLVVQSLQEQRWN